MLANSNVMAMIAVKDLAKGREFYEGTLGLKPADENPGGVAYKCGGGMVFVYQSDTAGQNKSTSATWEVTGIEDVVKQLAGKGVKFEHYDMPGVSYEGDVAVMGPMKAAWFRDPDGNILGLSQMS